MTDNASDPTDTTATDSTGGSTGSDALDPSKHDDSSTDTGKNEDVVDGSGHGEAESGEDTVSGGPA
ncbi:hypothetical protein [Marisediminicola sp. LYQ134]|uniref:hypothetical protein n=1 Tax=unclassified Marisediminicola TaxID=2618316 RepID=UPI00398349C8